MKQPKIRDLALDVGGTKRMRNKMAKSKKVKITINIDRDSLVALRAKSGETGVPYQRLLNMFLKEALQGQRHTTSRLERLEKELIKLKQRMAT